MKVIIFNLVVLGALGARAHSSEKDPFLRTEVIKTFGAGQTRFVDGRGLSTNRRLLRRSFGRRDVRRDRVEPIPYPPLSQARASLARPDAEHTFLRVREFWDVEQGFKDGFFGEGGATFDFAVPVHFTEGSWDAWSADLPVRLATDSTGAALAAEYLRRVVEHDSVLKTMPAGLGTAMLMSRVTGECAAYLMEAWGVPRRERDQLADEVLELARRIQENPNVESEVISATPALGIEVTGSREDFTVHYLDDVTVHARGSLRE